MCEKELSKCYSLHANNVYGLPLQNNQRHFLLYTFSTSRMKLRAIATVIFSDHCRDRTKHLKNTDI